VLLVRQHRYAQKKALIEIPAGKLEKGEDPLECGKRELQEETGFEAEEFESLGKMLPTPGYDSEIIYMYLAKNLKFRGQHLIDDECLEVEKMPFYEAVDKCLSGEIEDGKTLCALLKVARMRMKI